MKMLHCLGAASRDARKKARKRPVHIAAALDRDPATIQRFERGETWPRNFDRFLEGYAKVIEVDGVST